MNENFEFGSREAVEHTRKEYVVSLINEAKALRDLADVQDGPVAVSELIIVLDRVEKNPDDMEAVKELQKQVTDLGAAMASVI